MLHPYKKSKMSKFIKVALTIIATYISLIGLVTFSLFIMEEGLQTIMFGTWAAQEAKDWKLVLDGCDKMRQIEKLIRRTNRTLGWVQPLSYLAYKSYADSTEYYIRSLEMKTFSYDPGLFEGRKVIMNFTPKRAVKTGDDQYMLLAGRTFVKSDKPDLEPRVIKGYLFKDKNRWELRENKDSLNPDSKIKFSMKKKTIDYVKLEEYSTDKDLKED